METRQGRREAVTQNSAIPSVVLTTEAPDPPSPPSVVLNGAFFQLIFWFKSNEKYIYLSKSWASKVITYIYYIHCMYKREYSFVTGRLV